MKLSKALLALALALAALALPVSAMAGPVHDALRGDRLPPAGEALVNVVPPRGGSVMLYRDGKVAGWFLRPGAARVVPGATYGVMAMRGTHVLFHAGLTANPGLTELVWTHGDRPSIGYVPPLPRPHAHRAARPAPHAHPAKPHAHPAKKAQASEAPASKAKATKRSRSQRASRAIRKVERRRVATR
jgi:hypothetical protein